MATDNFNGYGWSENNWSLGRLPTSTDDAVIHSDGNASVNGTAVAHSLAMQYSDLVVYSTGTLAVGTSLTLDSSFLNIAGSVTVGTSLIGTISVPGSGQPAIIMSGGSLSAQSIQFDYWITGYGTVSGALSGHAHVEGGLKIEGSLANFVGDFYVDANSTLELSSGTSRPVTFETNQPQLATLKLDAPAAFTGSINNIYIGNTIDLVGIDVSDASYNGTILTINETNGQQLTYNVNGNIEGAIVRFAPDSNGGQGGTDIYWMTPVTESLAQDTGTSSNDQITSNPTLTGSGNNWAASVRPLVYFTIDGTPVANTVQTNPDGTWTYTPTGLSDGPHTIVASETDRAGRTSEASLTFTLDTTPPVVVITNASGPTNSAMQTVSGTVDVADAGTLVTLFDGSNSLGTVTVQPDGSWSKSITLSGDGSHTLTAQDTDAAGNTGTSNSVVLMPDTQAPTVAITSNGGLTNHAAQTVWGTVDVADVGTIVTLYDGTAALGTATVKADGTWSTPITLSGDGTHTLTAQDTDAAGNTGTSNASLTFTLDTTPPAAAITKQTLLHDTGVSATDWITNDGHVTLTGTVSDNNSGGSIEVFDGTADLGAATISGDTWTFSYNLTVGTHALAAVATDAAGNATTTAAQPAIIIDQGAPVPVITSELLSKNGAVTLTGTTSEANDSISVYDGTNLLGTTTTASDGTWSFTPGKVSNVIHNYTATATDLAGNVGHSSNEAILGSTKADTLLGTSGNDFVIGNGANNTITGGLGADMLTGGSGKVTFVYNAISDSTPSSHDTITDFHHGQDIIDFTNIAGINTKGGIPTFQGNLTGTGNLTLNAHSIAYIEVNGNTEVLVNTTNTAEGVTNANVSAANMEIVLVGVHLGLTSADFHHV